MNNNLFHKLKMTSLYSFFAFIIQALLVIVILTASSLEAQDLRSIKVSLNAVAVSFEEAMQLIERKTNFRFNYISSELPLNDRISINFDNESIYNILKTFAKEYSLTFSRINEQIIVKKAMGEKDEKSVKESGVIFGKIVDAITGEPLVGVIVKLNKTNIGTITDIQGNFRLSNIPDGNYTISFSYIGYEQGEITNIEVLENTEKQIDFKLKEKTILLKEITVTPGVISIMGNLTAAQQMLNKEEISTISLWEDLYRTIRRLPGITSNDYSAKFNVRGGENDEVLVNLDGLQLYEPFHMKDYVGGLLSIIDLSTVGGVNLFSGSFPAEYGNKMSGVFDVKTLNVKDNDNMFSAGLSFMNARLTSKGTFLDNKGSWLLSARRGFFDLVIKMAYKEDRLPSPVYYDILGKIKYDLSDNHSLFLNLLLAEDKLNFTENDDDYSETSYGNNYLWLTLNSVFNSKIIANTILAIGEITQRKQGVAYFGDTKGDIQFDVKDNRSFSITRLKQDWIYDIYENVFLKWGFDMNFGKSSYDYSYLWNRYVTNSNNQTILVTEKNRKNIKPSGNQYGIYLSDKMRLFGPLASEFGIRYDYISYIEKGLFSPRINLAYIFNNRTSLRAGWGYFYQPEELCEINIPHGEIGFHGPELSKHWLVGFEHFFTNGFNLRVEAYYKDISCLRPEYREFLCMRDLEIFPQFYDNIIKVSIENSISKGIEFFLKYDKGEKLIGWFSYIFSSKDDKISQIDANDGNKFSYNRYFPGANDQRHTINLDLSYRPSEDWDINLGWQYHSGWPFNDIFVRRVTEKDGKIHTYINSYEYFSQRLPSYSRIDLRVSKYFNTSLGRFTLYGEIINLLNRNNFRAYDYQTIINSAHEYEIIKEAYNWFPLLPSIGINWDMN